eukprot:6096657-Prymnesium_polylepis.1
MDQSPPPDLLQERVASEGGGHTMAALDLLVDALRLGVGPARESMLSAMQAGTRSAKKSRSGKKLVVLPDGPRWLTQPRT